MGSRLNVVDYNMDWVLVEHNFHERETPGVLTREEAIDYCARLGVGGIELMHAYWQDCEPEYVAELARNAGIPIRTYIFFSDLGVPPDQRASSVDHARQMVDRSVALGADLGMIVPGIAKSEYSVDDQLEWMTEGLSLCAEYAEAVGLTLASENIDYPPSRPLMGRSDQCLAVCDRVDSPHYRLIFDPAATVYVGENPLEALVQMLPQVAHVHLKNVAQVEEGERWHRTLADEHGTSYRGVNLDQGVIDLSGILKKLRDIDYQGDFLIEYQGEEDPRDAMRDNVAQAEALLDTAGLSNQRHDEGRNASPGERSCEP